MERIGRAGISLLDFLYANLAGIGVLDVKSCADIGKNYNWLKVVCISVFPIGMI